MLARVEAGFWISKSEVHALQPSSLQCPQVSEFSRQAGRAEPNCHAWQAVVESFCIRADEEVQFVPSVFTSPVSSAGPLLYHHAPWLCQSPTWALPSFSISSSTLPWPTPSSNTCASWTLTPNPPPHATPASSAPSVGQHSCLPDQSSSPNRQAGAAAHRPASSLAPDLMMFNSRVFLCVNLCRARLSLCGHAEGDDQVWNEHCPHELLPWNTWRELPHWSASGELIVQSHAELRECDAEADMEYRRLMLQSAWYLITLCIFQAMLARPLQLSARSHWRSTHCFSQLCT